MCSWEESTDVAALQASVAELFAAAKAAPNCLRCSGFLPGELL